MQESMKITFNNTDITGNRLCRKRIPIFDDLEDNVIYTFSGKSALSILLRYFRSTGKLKNKAGQVLVPHWLGYWVYMIMHKQCFPCTVYNPSVKGILVYHQWGFPQRMEPILEFCKNHDLFCIEDCAHAFEGSYKNRRLGTYGDAALFSLAKFFPCVTGGAIYSNSADIRKFAFKTLGEHNTALARSVFRHRITCDINPSEENITELERNYAVYDKLSQCMHYSRAVVQQHVVEHTLEKRRKYFSWFVDAFGGYDFLELFPGDMITPWAVPLFFSKNVSVKVVQALQKNSIETGIYHFDVQRNMLNPEFKECVAVPCHQGLTEDEIERIITIIKKAA